jgi:hypothetical protein
VDWLKLSVDLPDHPKVAELSDRAFRALIASWCYAARFETDGYLPHQAQRAVGMTAKLAGELEAAGLLHRNGSGWHVHDWDEHQPTAEEIARRRVMAAKRQASYRRRLRGEEGDA